MSRMIDIADAEARLELLVDEIEAGDEYVITRGGRPIARLVPAHIGFGLYDADADENGGRGGAR